MKLENCRTRKTAVRRNPAAAKIVKVDGGYAVFYTLDEYKIWKIKSKEKKNMLKNMTPHPVNIYSPDDATYVADQRKWFLKNGAKPIVVIVIPPSRALLNATQTVADDGGIDGIPIKKVSWDVSGFIPDPGTYYIVSALFKSAYKGLLADHLLTVGDPVYQSIDNPRPVGCLFLAH